MTTRAALLQGILDDPDDDARRLIYADWLEENGDEKDLARAKLIRLQIADHNLPEDDPRRGDGMEEAIALADDHSADWFPWVRHSDCLPHPQRGFLDHWTCNDEKGSIDDLADAFRHEPITDVVLSPKSKALPALAAWPQFDQVRKLDLSPDKPRERDILAFLSSARLSALRELKCSGEHGNPLPFVSACRLLASPRFDKLTTLSIGNASVGEEGAAALAGHSGLTSLSFGNCAMTVAACRRLLPLQRLEELGLGSHSLRSAEDGEAFTGLLARIPRLRRLTLGEFPFDDRAAASLAAAPWPTMRHLVLVPHNLNSSTPRSDMPRMTAEGVRRLARSSWLRSIETLNLSGHPMGDAGAVALADARLPHLRELTLMMTNMTATGLRRLVAAYSGQLSLLQLYGNPFGDAGARVIARASWPRMAYRPTDAQVGLLMGGCGIGDAGASALLASEGIPDTITELFLGSCTASARLLAALKERFTKVHAIRYG